MEEQITSLKQIAENLMQIKGNIRGEVFRTHEIYIRLKEGEKGVIEVEEKMAELGCPLKFKEIRALDWYQEALSVLAILVAKELFGWNEQDIYEMGNQAPKYSLIIRLVMKYFFSIRKAVEESPGYWVKHYDFGELEVAEFNEGKRQVILRIKGYKFHPLICSYHRGYFTRITQLASGSNNVTTEEVRCMFKGDPYHEYQIRY